jgi:hypothetical protein
MKKLITLILLFTITLFYSIPTQAYTLDGNDIPLVQTKNLFSNNVAQTLTVNGITIQSFGNGEFLFNGQPTTFSRVGLFNELNSQASAADIVANTNNFTIKNATNYRVSFSVVSGSITNPGNAGLNLLTSTANFINIYNLAGAETLTAASAATSAYFYIAMDTPVVFTNYRVRFQIEEGTTRTSYVKNLLTLNNIFLDSQLFLNPNFDNTSNYTISFNGSITNGNLTFPTFNPTITTQPQTHSIGNVLYYTTYAKRDNTTGSYNVGFLNSANLLISETPITTLTNIYSRQSSQMTLTDNVVNFRIGRVVGNSNVFIDQHGLYNLTTLGISFLSKETMDHYFRVWESNNAYIQGYNDGYTDGYNDGYTDGFNDGYDDGFDDGVASDTSFAVGYALGLSQGADMETGSSLLILIVALIGFILMIIGFITKRGIFNLLSTGAFIVLGGLLVEFVGFIIIAIGLVLINIYYAFFGNV